MKSGTILRILRDHFMGRSWRESYWSSQTVLHHMASLVQPANRHFARHVAENFFEYAFSTVKPIEGQSTERAKAAVKWILAAQKATSSGGVSLGYFPCGARPGWQLPYPETTGYIIPSLLEFARIYGDETAAGKALEMADWEIDVQMASGAVQGGTLCAREKQTPASFNTGMVLAGWSAAYRTTGDSRFLHAGRRAAEFLVADVGSDGYFRTNSQFVSPSNIKTYNCLCAWPLYQFCQDVENVGYQGVAIKLIEAALRQQKSNGWFANNCLTNCEAPLLHTICYTLQGVLEVGILARREEFIRAVERGTDPIIKQLSPNGFVPARFYSDWRPASFSVCLTGVAQLAVVCYRLCEVSGKFRYRTAADQLVNWLKGLQCLDSRDEYLNGALGGSFPLLAGYMTLGYPNWATKYLLDSLMLQDKFERQVI